MAEETLQPNSFLTVLQRKEIQESLMTEASKLLGELALAVKQTKKKGSLVLTLSVEPEKGGALAISAALNQKSPSTSPQALTIFYVESNGALSRDNPDQRELGLTAHDGGRSGNEEETTTEEQATA